MEYEKCFVAFIDLLGFKNLIKTSSCEDIYSIFGNFKIPFSNIYFEGTPYIEPSALKFKTMSDSMIFYIKDDSKNALFHLLMACNTFQSDLINLENPILSRGGIFHGDFYINGDIMFGPALTQAYLLESQNAKYPRIIMTKSLLESLEKKVRDSFMFEDIDGFWTIDYFSYIKNSKETGIKDLERFTTYVNDILDKTIDNSIREKYLYIRDRIKKTK